MSELARRIDNRYHEKSKLQIESLHPTQELEPPANPVCLSPVKLCHYLSVTGEMRDGSETLFG